MAGRGCTVKVQVLNPSRGGDGIDEIFLPVALHSPLLVFKQRLAECSDIDVNDQVLIFCDLSDPDRNSDVVLNQDYDNISLRDCNFTADSLLTLHALGMSAERRAALLRSAATNAEAEKQALELKTRNTVIMATPTTAANADHSFNGIIFDIVAKGAYEVQVASISLAGMLGRCRIFARDRPWAEGQPRQEHQHYWGHHPGVANTGWKLVADQVCKPSWDRPTEIFFDEPFTLLPHERKAFYCHSGLPHDLGIQYQSCRGGVVTCQDECMAILPGLGHCGSVPFDNEQGWFRHARSPCGMVRYRAKVKGYHMREHKIFPFDMREAARTLLGCYYSARMARRSPLSSSSPRYRPPNTPTITEVAWGAGADTAVKVKAAGAGEGVDCKDATPSLSDYTSKSNTPIRSNRRRKWRSDSEEEAFLMEQADRSIFDGDSEEVVEANVSEAEDDSDTVPMDMVKEEEASGASKANAPSLSLQLPSNEEGEKKPDVYPALSIINDKYLSYNILEFCNWDWFAEVAAKKAKAAAEERRAQAQLLGESDSDGDEDEDEDEDGGYPGLTAPRRSVRVQRSQSATGRVGTMNTSRGVDAQTPDLRRMVAQMLGSYGIPDDDDVVTMFMNRIVTGQTAGDSEEEEGRETEVVEGETEGSGTTDLPSFFTGIGDNDPHIYDDEGKSSDEESAWESESSDDDDEETYGWDDAGVQSSAVASISANRSGDSNMDTDEGSD